MTSDNFVPLKLTDIAVGKPLPWPVYDEQRKLLLREGFVIESVSQVESLISKGLFRNSSWKSTGPAKGTVAPDQKAPDEGENTEFSYEDMKPKIGDPVQLHVKTGMASERYTVSLIGYVKGKTIIITAPSSNGYVALMREGQLVIVRSFSGTNAYGFSSNVLRVCSAPLPYLHLSYPKSVKCVAVRKTARVHFDLIGSVVSTTEGMDDKSYPTLISDISVSGASFTVNEPMAGMNDTLVLSFRTKVNDLDAYPAINCIVRSITDEGGIGGATIKLRYGVQFKDVPADVALLLQNMIYQKMLENT